MKVDRTLDPEVCLSNDAITIAQGFFGDHIRPEKHVVYSDWNIFQVVHVDNRSGYCFTRGNDPEALKRLGEAKDNLSPWYVATDRIIRGSNIQGFEFRKRRR